MEAKPLWGNSIVSEPAYKAEQAAKNRRYSELIELMTTPSAKEPSMPSEMEEDAEYKEDVERIRLIERARIASGSIFGQGAIMAMQAEALRRWAGRQYCAAYLAAIRKGA